MHVLQLLKNTRRGGAEVLAASLAAVHRSDVRLTFGYFFDGAADSLDAEILAAGAQLVQLRTRSNAGVLSSVDRVVRLVKRERVDIIHGHLPLVGAVARLAGSIAGCPVVYTEHNVFGRYHPLTRAVAAATWRAQARVIAVSEEVRSSLRGFGEPPNVTVIPNGVDVARHRRDDDGRAAVRARLRLADDDLVVGTVAIFRKAKRLDRWVDVARRIAATEARARFLIVGFGPLEEEVRAAVAGAGLAPVVRFAGAQNDVRAFLSAMDVYLMTSDFEGLPIALLEAMACELPAVSTAVGGIAEVLEDGVSGALCRPGESAPSQLADHVLRLLGEPKTRAELGARARARVIERHSLQAMARRIERVYDDVIAGRSASVDT